MTPAVIKPTDIAPAPRRAVARRPRRRSDVRPHAEGRLDISLWIPSTAIFVVLAPFALVLMPLLYFAPRDMRPDPFRTMLTLGTLLLALTGTVVEVDTPDARVRLRYF